VSVFALTALGACHRNSRGLLVTTKPLDVGIAPHPLCIAVTTAEPLRVTYWDPGADCSTRWSSVGTAVIVDVANAGRAERTVRVRIALHVGMAEVSLRVTPRSIRSLQTGALQPARPQTSIPSSSVLDRMGVM
jgi:hypothetical protein